jgi:hypothetical protein
MNMNEIFQIFSSPVSCFTRNDDEINPKQSYANGHFTVLSEHSLSTKAACFAWAASRFILFFRMINVFSRLLVMKLKLDIKNYKEINCCG